MKSGGQNARGRDIPGGQGDDHQHCGNCLGVDPASCINAGPRADDGRTEELREALREVLREWGSLRPLACLPYVQREAVLDAIMPTLAPLLAAAAITGRGDDEAGYHVELGGQRFTQAQWEALQPYIEARVAVDSEDAATWTAAVAGSRDGQAGT